MRRLTRTVFTTVSLATFLSLTSVHSYAVQPAIQILGVMKQKDQWQVGTVDNQGDKYCAMVGNFDQASVLAFARNPAGFGSLAIEFREDMFTKGKDYEVQLTVDTGIPMTFTGKASNARSLVIQIGQDSAVYNALSTSKTLRFSSAAIDAKFALSKFSAGYKKLVNCATDLMPIDPSVPQMAAVKVGDVEAVEMTDDRLAKAVLEEAKTTTTAEPVKMAAKADTAGNEITAAATEEPQEEKKSFFGKIFGKFKGSDSTQEAEQPVETAEVTGTSDIDSGAKKKPALVAKAETPLKPLPKPVAAQKAAASDAITEDVTAEVKTESVTAEAPLAETQPQPETIEAKPAPRKLLAAVNGGGLTAPAMPEKTGLSAREMEAQQTAALQKAIHGKENEIAVLAAVRAQAARNEFAAAELQQKIFSRKAGEVLMERDLLEKQAAEEAKAATDVALKTDKTKAEAVKTVQADKAAMEAKRLSALKQKDAELAKLEAEKVASDKALADKLAEMQAKFGAEKAALETERDTLKQKLAAAQNVTETVLPEKTAALATGQKRVQDLEQKLGSAETARQDLAQTLSDMEAQNQKLLATLQQKEQALKDTSADVVVLAKQQKEMAALQKQLAEKSMQSAALEEALTAEKAKASAALAAAVGEKDTALDTLETRLSEAEAGRKLEGERAAKLEEARIEAEKKVAALEASLAEAKAKADAEMAAAAAAAASQAAAEAEAKMKAEMVIAKEKAEAEASLKAEQMSQEQQAALEAKLALEKKELAVANEKALMQAETEIALLKEEKERLQNQLADKAKAQTEAVKLSRTEQKPVAAAIPAPKPVSVERIPGTDVALAVSKIEPAAGTMDVEVFDPPVTAMPVVPMRPAMQMQAPVLTAPIAAPMQNNSAANRAESFLDGIMKHHVPAGTAAAVGKPQAPAAMPMQKTAPVSMQQQPLVAAPTSTVAPVKPALMPVATPMAGSDRKDISLETLLDQAGVRGAVFTPMTTPGIRQWSLGSINGMYEELPTTNGAFERAVSKYINRYEQDCPQQLSVQMGRPQKTAAGLMAQGSMHCDMPGNAYSTAMIFVEDNKTFGALLHSGQVADLAQVKSLGDNLYYALSASGGIAGATMPQKAVAMPQMQPANDFPPPVTEQPAMRFNLRNAAPQQADEFETVVVQ
jgi:hypothetical protein